MKLWSLLRREKYLQLSNISTRSIFSYESKEIHRIKKHHNPIDLTKLLKKELKGEILYGIHPIKAALATRRRHFYKLYISESAFESRNEEMRALLEEVGKLGVEVSVQKKSLLNHLSEGRPHQGVCMDVTSLQPVPFNRKDHVMEDDVRWLLLDSIQDPMNFGSILRSAYFFAFNKIFINNKNNCRLTSTVSKASAGAMELSRVYCVQSMREFVEELKDQDWLVIGSTVSRSRPSVSLADGNCFKEKKVAIVLGNEGVGIEKGLEERCSAHIHIMSSPTRSSSSSPPSSQSPSSAPPSSSLTTKSSSASSLPIIFHLDSLNVNVVAGIVLNAFSLKE